MGLSPTVSQRAHPAHLFQHLFAVGRRGDVPGEIPARLVALHVEAALPELACAHVVDDAVDGHSGRLRVASVALAKRLAVEFLPLRFSHGRSPNDQFCALSG
jgi:hypothetical protein